MIDNSSNVITQHDCLRVRASTQNAKYSYQIISYCLTEHPSQWNIQDDNSNQKFTFVELYQQNITSEQLYLWSAPIDVIERYQFYLNELAKFNNLSSVGFQVFYNCSLPRFGPKCEYSLDNYEHTYSSLSDMIYTFYQQIYQPTSLTCYIHLKCDRGSTHTCLDWTEICNGRVDCLNDQIDEEYCWLLEINQCREGEYRCDNGQCIPKEFFKDGLTTFECLDRSDEVRERKRLMKTIQGEPIFANEDVTCSLTDFQLYTKLTGSCVRNRDVLVRRTYLLDKPKSLSNKCWLTFKCYFRVSIPLDPICTHICPELTCERTINETCPEFIFLPATPVAFGHIYAMYTKKDLIETKALAPSHYICYNGQLCGGFYPNTTILKINNSTCRRPQDFPIRFPLPIKLSWIDRLLAAVQTQLYQCNTIIYKDFIDCQSIGMYRCLNSSKCIAIHRLCDNIDDCDYKDDENCSLINGTCAVYQSEKLFKCTTKPICISSKRVHDNICDCGFNQYDLCDDEITYLDHIRKHISFPNICDHFIQMIPFSIGKKNETDETDCEHWPCNNMYTRCDGIWHCPNGADEIDCESSPLLQCSTHHHICVSSETYQLICLPIEKANDGNIDCLGGMDEPKLCQWKTHDFTPLNYHCVNGINQSCISLDQICSHRYKYDKQLPYEYGNYNQYHLACNDGHQSFDFNIRKYLCDHHPFLKKQQMKNFSLEIMRSPISNTTSHILMRKLPVKSPVRGYDQRCHRGLPLTVHLNHADNATIKTCLCPPSFYGNMCQYQNQRVSLTMRFQTFSDSRRTIFSILTLLIDDSNENVIHSHQQLTYLYTQHCQTKFNVYLLYSNRPKLTTRNYSIHIDIYEKITLTYRGSLRIPMNYTFLPVHRVAVQLYIPKISSLKDTCLNEYCIHGQCVKYSNDLTGIHTFCRCYPGWSGRYCTKPYNCKCSSDSLCIGMSADNRPICLCPLNRWGSFCRLLNTVCQLNQNNTCYNGGQCVPVDDFIISDKPFICICPKGFSGERCEIIDNQIILSFHKDIMIPQSILVHFIRVIDNAPPENGSTFKTISINQKMVTIQWSHPFHIAFVELFNNNYYLITVQTVSNQSSTIEKTIKPSDRCKHVSEVFNETIVKLHLLRRIKYYHLPCQMQRPALSCFYDDSYFCLCYKFDNKLLSNCFEFNSSTEHDCFGQSNCENGAKCLQDKAMCPQTSICVCPTCFYGTRCQFSSSFFGISLDAILGHHIQPHVNMTHQPIIIKISIILTSILILIGLVNGILSLMTFTNKETQKVGCGLYLLGSSITTLLTVVLFTLKFWILIIAQMTYITTHWFLSLQCYSIDFLLRVCLSMDQWLNACVAMERVFTIIKGTHFQKKKSVKIAKYAIIVLVCLTITTIIHDPIHRRLLYDNDDDDHEKRIWCIVRYSTSFRIYNSIVNVFHFFAPFLLNIISACTIIFLTTRQRTNIQQNLSYGRLFRRQFSQHRYLLISPIVLVILALPRLIISFISSCMDSYNGSWLFLFGYFISFFPSMVTFLVFVVPSEFYKKEFRKTIKRYQRIIGTRLRPT